MENILDYIYGKSKGFQHLPLQMRFLMFYLKGMLYLFIYLFFLGVMFKARFVFM